MIFVCSRDNISNTDWKLADEIIILDSLNVAVMNELQKCNNNITVLDSPIQDDARYEETLKDVYLICDRIILHLASFLKSEYGIEFETKQCSYIFKPYLLTHIFDIYCKYLKVKDICDKEWMFYVQDRKVTPFLYSDSPINGDQWHSFLYAIVLDALGATVKMSDATRGGWRTSSFGKW